MDKACFPADSQLCLSMNWNCLSFRFTAAPAKERTRIWCLSLSLVTPSLVIIHPISSIFQHGPQLVFTSPQLCLCFIENGTGLWKHHPAIVKLGEEVDLLHTCGYITMVHIKSPNYPTQLPSKDMLSLSLRPHQHHLQPVDTPATPSSVEAWIQSISTGEYPQLGSAGIPLGVCWQARKEETNSLVPSPHYC